LDHLQGTIIWTLDRWPCLDQKNLLVGSESSGTTAVANLLYQGVEHMRFLEEGDESWVWHAYQSVYQGHKTIRDYPRLQLFDAVKVPGFAVIIGEFREAFPNSDVIYLVRDPRDVVNSAVKTWKVASTEELAGIPWSRENWLDIAATDPVERIATRWKTYLHCATAQEDVHFLRYEDFCADKVAAVRKLAEMTGLPFDEDRVRTLKDRQLSRQPTRAYHPQGPGGWRNGILREEHIRSIERVCGEEMGVWGYKAEFQ
jgi:hypothetical protein